MGVLIARENKRIADFLLLSARGFGRLATASLHGTSEKLQTERLNWITAARDPWDSPSQMHTAWYNFIENCRRCHAKDTMRQRMHASAKQRRRTKWEQEKDTQSICERTNSLFIQSHDNLLHNSWILTYYFNGWIKATAQRAHRYTESFALLGEQK